MIWFILATIGLTNIIVHGKILDVIGVRSLIKKYLPQDVCYLFECYECMGFWTGMICGAALVSLNPVWILACGFAGSLLSQTYVDLIEYIRSQTDYVIPDSEE